MNEIKLVTTPVISHELKLAGQHVTQRITDLNIDGQIPTEETRSALKKLRAELNKELTDYEDQRSLLKKAILNPYQDFESLYKTEISEKYTVAINTLKDKIEQVESRMRQAKKAEIVQYFNELILCNSIDFCTFEQTNIKIDLSTSEKSLKEEAAKFVNQIVSDLELIETQAYRVEILAEYKRSLNCSQSIKSIVDRKEREKQEAAKQLAIQTLRRENELKKHGFEFVEFSGTWEKEDQAISKSKVETLTDSDFKVEIAKMLEILNPVKQADLFGQVWQSGMEIVTAPLAAPIIDTTSEIYEASFCVSGTKKQLQMLKAFLLLNNISYKTI